MQRMTNPDTPKQGPVDLATQSVAGEEDPGAALDLTQNLASGAANNACPRCHGTGHLEGQPCNECKGTGRMTASGGKA